MEITPTAKDNTGTGRFTIAAFVYDALHLS
jgi:hypothetical protein